MRAWMMLIVIGGCGGARVGVVDDDLDVAAREPVAERDFTLAWHGARVGEARERETWDADGVTLERRERIAVRRDGRVNVIDAAITVRANRALVALQVAWRESASDGTWRSGLATRDGDRWEISISGEAMRRVDGRAVPEELVPLRVRRDGGFRGDVMMAGRGFAVARGEVIATGHERLRATITTDAGALVAAIETDRYGDALVIAGSDGTVARRASAAEVAARFDPPEVVDGAAIAIDGELGAGAVTIGIDGVTRAPPPVLPGQTIVASEGATWTIALRAEPPAGSIATVRALSSAVFAEDRGGDCTAHALAFVARAAAAGLETRVVTGWRVDGDRHRLVRHRWALARGAGEAWTAVDPSYGEAPASPRLIGLAISGDRLADLATADLAFAGTEGATARVTP